MRRLGAKRDLLMPRLETCRGSGSPETGTKTLDAIAVESTPVI